MKAITRDLEDVTLSALPEPKPLPARLPSAVSVASSLHTRAPSEQITSVLGSLQDLLITKDRQIERDARELAVLRHTLLEMDEKLQRKCHCSSVTTPSKSPATPRLMTPGTPEITITATESSWDVKDGVVQDLQSQLSTAMAALENVRMKSRSQAERISHLEAGLGRAEKRCKEQVRDWEGKLAMEKARCKGVEKERDVAKMRLEKVKEDLFAVA